jgi:hypothetical protein
LRPAFLRELAKSFFRKRLRVAELPITTSLGPGVFASLTPREAVEAYKNWSAGPLENNRSPKSLMKRGVIKSKRDKNAQLGIIRAMDTEISDG